MVRVTVLYFRMCFPVIAIAFIIISLYLFSHTVGHIATHAIVVANLITKEVNHGIHLFMVQLRSLQDH